MKPQLQHPHLAAYVNEFNRIHRVARPLPVNPPDLDALDIEVLEQQIENDLSPENLTCDGELSRSQVRDRRSALNQVLRELHALMRMQGKRADKSFDRLALQDYLKNPEEWAKFLSGPASQLGKNKLSKQAHFWVGAKDETRAAILKSALGGKS